MSGRVSIGGQIHQRIRSRAPGLPRHHPRGGTWEVACSCGQMLATKGGPSDTADAWQNHIVETARLLSAEPKEPDLSSSNADAQFKYSLDEWATRCEQCGAEPFKICVSKSGRPSAVPHPARRKLGKRLSAP